MQSQHRDDIDDAIPATPGRVEDALLAKPESKKRSKRPRIVVAIAVAMLLVGVGVRVAGPEASLITLAAFTAWAVAVLFALCLGAAAKRETPNGAARRTGTASSTYGAEATG